MKEKGNWWSILVISAMIVVGHLNIVATIFTTQTQKQSPLKLLQDLIEIGM